MSCKRGTYSTFENYWGYQKENFFVSYAIRGPIVVPSMGLEAGMPVNHPIPGPVSEPSPLNNRWKYSPDTLFSGIC
jgi:hypothetical protein